MKVSHSEFENVNEVVSWNLSQGIINEITFLLQGATRYYIGGNIIKALFHLQSIRMRISANLDDTELKKMRETEMEFMEYIKNSKTKGFKQSEEQRMNYLKTCICYSYYNDLLMKYLKKYGYLIPAKEDNTIMI